MADVWLVWSEGGEYEEYESFSRDLRGVFATEQLANEHAEALRKHGEPEDGVEVERRSVFDELPKRGRMLEISAVISVDGCEWHWGKYNNVFVQDNGPERTEFDVWLHEWPTLEAGAQRKPRSGLPRWIFAKGTDHAAVERRYRILLEKVRRGGITKLPAV